jgi:hypothetical protein
VDHYCTYFDRNYLAQGLTLYRSLARHSSPFTLWALCFDDPALDVLSKLDIPEIRPVSLRTLEENDPDLQKAKQGRSLVEYYFTCTPSWPLYLLNRYPDMDRIAHRFPEHLRHKEIYGIYNVGLLSFQNDSRGKECLHWWRERCLEWCFDRPEEGRFADQKYLDDWPDRFPGTTVLRHKGAGLGPWNWMNYRIELQDAHPLVDGHPLIFYHFQGYKILSRRFYDPGFFDYGPMPHRLRRLFYDGYAKAIFETERWVRTKLPSIDLVTSRFSWRHYPRWKLASHFLHGRLRVIPK